VDYIGIQYYACNMSCRSQWISGIMHPKSYTIIRQTLNKSEIILIINDQSQTKLLLFDHSLRRPLFERILNQESNNNIKDFNINETLQQQPTTKQNQFIQLYNNQRGTWKIITAVQHCQPTTENTQTVSLSPSLSLSVSLCLPGANAIC
jgi:hypothetical protein